MEKKPRRQYSPEEKVRILRLHLLEGKAVSEICEREGIHPTSFYQWQRTFFENGSAAFISTTPLGGVGVETPFLTIFSLRVGLLASTFERLGLFGVSEFRFPSACLL
jgi:hypothetical protein